MSNLKGVLQIGFSACGVIRIPSNYKMNKKLIFKVDHIFVFSYRFEKDMLLPEASVDRVAV